MSKHQAQYVAKCISVENALNRYPKPITKRVLIKIAKENGCIRKMGRTLFFIEDDLNKLDRLLLCPVSNSENLKTVPTGTFAAPLTKAEELEKAQARLTKNKPKLSKQNSKLKCSNVTYLAQKQ